jgi:alcohol dehydrogenase class IV
MGQPLRHPEVAAIVNRINDALRALPCPDRPGVFGNRAIEFLPFHTKEHKPARILLVTGKASFELSGASRVVAELEDHASLLQWSDFDPNPSASDLSRGIKTLNEFQPEMIIGVGGGSVMDMAKLLCAFAGTTDVSADLQSAVETGFGQNRRASHLVLTPTTAGSGSEATHFAAVYVGPTKHSVASPSLLADFVVLDPNLAVSASAYQKATSGIDAVCQAMESLWAVGSTAHSRRFAVEALTFLIPALPSWVGGNKQVAGEVVAGSHLAGRAIDVSKTTGPHAMSYSLTNQYGISHGHAVALTFGAFAAAHSTATAGRLHPGLSFKAHEAAMHTVAHALGLYPPTSIADWFGRYCVELGLDLGLLRHGVSQESLASLAQSVNLERLSNNPLMMTESDLRDILQASL